VNERVNESDTVGIVRKTLHYMQQHSGGLQYDKYEGDGRNEPWFGPAFVSTMRAALFAVSCAIICGTVCCDSELLLTYDD
jgi:hypothetical protein